MVGRGPDHATLRPSRRRERCHARCRDPAFGDAPGWLTPFATAERAASTDGGSATRPHAAMIGAPAEDGPGHALFPATDASLHRSHDADAAMPCVVWSMTRVLGIATALMCALAGGA